jgi:methylenetetrahydrofolate--tRNA-(uracil-5-)-methyltransferase
MLGGLYRYLRECAPGRFQPMNSNWGLVDPLYPRIRDKRERRLALAERALADFRTWMAETGIDLWESDGPTRMTPPRPEAAPAG